MHRLHFFGAEVRRAREAAGMTLADLGAIVPCDASTVSRIESGLLSPTERFAAACDEAFPQMGGWYTRFCNNSRKWEGPYPRWFADWLDAEAPDKGQTSTDPAMVANIILTFARPPMTLADLPRPVLRRLASTTEVNDMGIGPLRDLAGEWELAVDLPGAEDVRGHVLFEVMGEVLVQRTTVPAPEAPDSCCLVIAAEDGGYVQHYFDSRGVARLYAMTFDGRTWTLERTTPDLSPLDFCQRFVATISDDGATIEGEWQSSDDGRQWTRDFGLTYTRIGTAR